MLTTIHLGGFLGRRFGRTWRLDLSTPSPAEAVRALCAVVDGFRAFMLEHSEPGFHVFTGRRSVQEDALQNPTSGDITIIPALGGAKSGWFQVILGAVLITAGVVMAVTGYGAAFAQPLIMAGISIALGGVSKLLFQPPAATPPKEEPKSQPNYNFNGPVNTISQGHPVPVCYGMLEVGSQVISAGIRVEWQVGGGFASNGRNGGGGGGCPAPWVPILLADGREIPAGELRPGMMVWTQHEQTMEWGAFPVEAVERIESSQRVKFKLENGREFSGSPEHRVWTLYGWHEVRELVGGDSLFFGHERVKVLGAPPGVHGLGIFQDDPGPVMKITVRDAHTYVSSGFLSHNAKKTPDIDYEEEYIP